MKCLKKKTPQNQSRRMIRLIYQIDRKIKQKNNISNSISLRKVEIIIVLKMHMRQKMKEKLNYKVFYGNGTTLISNVALHLFQTWDFVHLWSNHDFHGPSKHPSLLVTRKLLPSCVRLLQFCLNFVNNFQQSYEPFIDLFFPFSFHLKNLTPVFLFFSFPTLI